MFEEVRSGKYNLAQVLQLKEETLDHLDLLFQLLGDRDESRDSQTGFDRNCLRGRRLDAIKIMVHCGH